MLATTKTEARERLKALRSSADKGLPVTPGDITLGQLLVAWEAKGLPNRDLSPSQRMAHRWAIGILTEDLGRRRLRTMSPDHVEAAFARRALGVERTAKTSGRGRVAGGSLSRGSLIKLRSTLNRALAWAQIVPALITGNKAERRAARATLAPRFERLLDVLGEPLELM